MNLKQAIDQGKLDQFIAEHPEVKGDMDAFNRTVEAMAGKSSEARQTSSQDGSDD
jgi:hypothetical protein